MEDAVVSLSKGIYLHKPAVTRLPQDDDPAAPTIILIFGWMGARLAHLLKYSNSYTELYPQATQIIVQSDPSFFWSRAVTQRAYLQPVVVALELLNCLPPAPKCTRAVTNANLQPLVPFHHPRVLVHAFSNGGSSQLAMLSEMLQARSTNSYYRNSGEALAPSALVLDSCPGNAGVRGTIRAFTAAIRSPLVRFVTIAFISMAYYFQAITFRILGTTGDRNIIDAMKRKLQHPYLLPWFNPRTTPRLYLYSRKDELIPVDQVEDHATQAQEEHGYPVTTEDFGDSPHVSHARMYPERYWELVRKLWKEAVERAEKR